MTVMMQSTSLVSNAGELLKCAPKAIDILIEIGRTASRSFKDRVYASVRVFRWFVYCESHVDPPQQLLASLAMPTWPVGLILVPLCLDGRL